MSARAKIQQLMPLMREFGTLERQRLHAGVTPLEYQRWLDLKGKIGERFARSRATGLEKTGGEGGQTRRTRLVIGYRSRDALVDSIVTHIKPVGFFIPTPFAANPGSEFLARVTLEREGDSADFPICVVTSMCESSQTISTMSMGMGVKFLPRSRAEGQGISKLFGGELDQVLRIEA